jgi:hypothetical protein
MKRMLFSLILLGAGLSVAAETDDLPQARIQEIIQKFAEKESEFAKVREGYTWRQSAKLTEFDEDGTPGGKWEQVWDVVFTQAGRRTENVVKAPMATLRLIQMDPGDEQDLRSTQPFVLTSQDLPNYTVTYLGRENVDEIGCFVFSVKPKKLEQGKRYFQGQVWVDDRDLQIVKSYGRGTGFRKKGTDFQYPKFETYREQIDGKYWFPTYTIANDVLQFATGQNTRIKQVVTYSDYKQFKSDTKIIFDTEEAKPDPKPVVPPPTKKP